MEERNERDAGRQNEGNESSGRSQSQTGDPGRTPGKAEGEEEDANDKLGNSDSESN